MAVYTYSRVPAFNPNTSPVSVAKSATGSVYDIGDTGFLTALSLTLVASNTATTTLVSDANGMFPDFNLTDRTQCVFKSGALVFVLTTTTPVPGPAGPASTVAGPAGPATTDASLLAAGTVADARLPVRLGDQALNATYARTGSAGLELWDRGADHADGAIATANTGQVYALHGTPLGQPNVKPSIVGGKLVQVYSAGAGAGYLQALHGSDIITVGGSWTFSAGSTTNSGSAVLIAWDNDYAATSPTVPNSPCHLIFYKTSWTYGVFQGGVLTDIASGQYSVPLAADGVTVHTAEVLLDKPNGTAYITLPDGQTAVVKDSRIGTIPARYAVWEMIRSATTDTNAKFTEWWSDSRHSSRIVQAKGRSVSREGAATYHPATPDWMAVPTAEADVKPGVLEVAVVPGPSGKVIVDMSAYLQVTDAATSVIWAVGYGGSDLSGQYVIKGLHEGQVTATALIENLLPGSLYTLRWRHMLVGTAVTAIFVAGNNGYYATISARAI